MAQIRRTTNQRSLDNDFHRTSADDSTYPTREIEHLPLDPLFHEAQQPYDVDMASSGGGVAAAFGFRYQYLVTVELLLDMYESDSQPDWRVDIDRIDQDSADVLVYDGGQDPVCALQIKASMPASSTTMSMRSASICLDALQVEHPGARELKLITNRTLTQDAVRFVARLNEHHEIIANGQRRIVDARDETLLALTARLIKRVARIRVRGGGGIGQRLHHILVSLLVDLVHDCGSQTARQSIDPNQVACILNESAAVIADASGERAWGRTFGVPDGRFLPRSSITKFLTERLRADDLLSGVPSVAVLSGISGSGKSAAAATWAASRREHYAFTLWIDASSDKVLTEQQPAILDRLGGEGYAGDAPAQIFCDLLSDLPVPWLLVLDGAADWPTAHKWIPPSGYGHVIVTTNRGDWPIDTAPVMTAEAMTAEEATALIRDRLSKSSLVDPVPAIDPVAAEFAIRLGSWPLAIDLACAWIRSLGGDFSRLRDFLDRLDRFDLTKDDSVLGSYPRSAGRVVRELLSSLSVQSFTVLSVVTASGGSHVPVVLLDEWASSLAEGPMPLIDVRAALDELIGTSLVNKQIRFDVKSVQGFDEAIYVHDGILVAVRKLEIEIRLGYLYSWMNTCSDVLTSLIDQALFSDASALLPATDQLLATVLSATPGDDNDRETAELFQVSATVLMHNVGSLAIFTGLFELASKWLTCAFKLREQMRSTIDHDERALAVMQIQTLATLAQAVVRQKRFEQVRPILERAVNYASGHCASDPGALDTPVSRELYALADAARYAQEDCSDLRDWIVDTLEQYEGASPEDSPLQLHVREFASAVTRAQRYAETEQWSKAADTALTICNEAAAAEALTHDGIELALDTGAALTHSLLARPHRQIPSPLKGALQRITQWCHEFSDLLNDDQQARLSILTPIAELDVRELHRALEHLRATATDSKQMDAWRKLGEAAAETIAASNRTRDLLGAERLPDGLEIVRSIDGGTNCLWWPVITQGDGEAALVFVSASVSMFVGDTVQDPMLNSIVQAGFPDRLDADGRPRPVIGWTLHVDGLNLVLCDATGVKWLKADVNPGDKIRAPWIDAIRRADWVRVIYTDPADRSPDELLAVPHQGLVAVVGEPSSRWQRLRKFFNRK